MGTGSEALLFALVSSEMGQVRRPWVAEGPREFRKEFSVLRGPVQCRDAPLRPLLLLRGYGSPRQGKLSERFGCGPRATQRTAHTVSNS